MSTKPNKPILYRLISSFMKRWVMMWWAGDLSSRSTPEDRAWLRRQLRMWNHFPQKGWLAYSEMPRKQWRMNDTEDYLREVYNYPGPLAIITEAAKKKGMRFDVASFKDGEISYMKGNIMILRGDAAEFMDRLLECGPSCVSRKQTEE